MNFKKSSIKVSLYSADDQLCLDEWLSLFRLHLYWLKVKTIVSAHLYWQQAKQTRRYNGQSLN